MKIKRICSLLLALTMLLSLLPLSALADDSAPAAAGTVRVVVENTTCKETDTGSWVSGATAWTGTLVDKTVEITSSSTAVTCLQAALAEGNYSLTGAESAYITEINGLQADSTSYAAGWMFTLNDWFTNQPMDRYTVADKTLRDGDTIALRYTMNMGPDIGSIANDTTKTLASLEITGGTLSPKFASGTKTYELALGEGVTSANLTVTPAAYDKNFQVRTYHAATYDPAKTGYRPGETVPVSVGDSLKIVVGHPDWPSMNNGSSYGGAEKVEAGVYTVAIVETATEAAGIDSFFQALDGVATVTNGAGTGKTDYPFAVTDDGTALVSTNKGVSSSASSLSLTFTKAAELSFSYKASSESGFDYLVIRKNGAALNNDYSEKSKFSGDMTEFKTYTIQLAAGDVLTLEYSKDSSGDEGDDCVYLKDFAVTLPHSVIFHANDGTDTTATQGVFGTANLTANAFTRDGYRFDGWATSAGSSEIAYADGASVTLQDADLDLYAVWTKVWRVTFPNLPQGAVLEVQNAAGETLTPESDGSYILQDGAYTYTASLFGYETASNVTFTVSGADLAVADTLQESTKYVISFTFTGLTTEAVPAITLRNEYGEVMTAEEDGTYRVPVGAYDYLITTTGYKKVTGTITVTDADAPQTIALEPFISWDGTAAEPTLAGNTYQIATAENLAWLAQQVNAGHTDYNAVLTADLNLNTEGGTDHAWTPIGTSANPYAGSFDGAGHTITGLYFNETSGTGCGLFGYTASGATVANLTLESANIRAQKAVGLAVGSNAGLVSGITVRDSAVAGAEQIGGIVGSNTGTVEACSNESATVTQDTKKDSGIGGIVGESAGTVTLCANRASLVRSHTGTNYGYFGGLVGNLSKGTLTDSYNLGTVDTAYYVGGFTGRAVSGTAITNCYNAGIVPVGKKALVGNGSATVTNCYYLDTCGATDTYGESKTIGQLQTLAPTLGGSFAPNPGGYPILKWEDPNATYSVTLTVLPADASVTFHGEALAATEDGVYTVTGLQPGSYAYRVTRAEGDYAPEDGTVTVGKADVQKTVTLQQRRYAVTFTLTPATAALTLTQGEGDDAETLTPASSENGTVVYQLVNGTYHYRVTAFGYESQSGDVTVDKAAVEQPVTLTRSQTYTLRFTGAPEGAAITVSHPAGGIQSANDDGSYTLAAETYQYTIKLKGYRTCKGEITLAKDETVEVTMTPNAPWDGSEADAYDGGTGTKDDPYQIATGEQLRRLAVQTAAAAANSNYYFVQTEDIDLGGLDFAPIGSSSQNFKGTYDGDGHTIRNFTQNMTEANAGLFGYVAGSIQNLTVANATITSTANNAGVLVGRLQSGSITGVTVRDSSVTGKYYVGALAGYAAAAVKNSAVLRTAVTGAQYTGGAVGQLNNAALTGTYASGVTVQGASQYTGGLIGNAYGGSSKVEDAFARGSVSGGQYTGGLLGGNGGYSSASVKRCYTTCDVTSTTSDFGALFGRTSYLSASYCFYSTDASVTGSSGSGATAGTGKTAAELKDAAILNQLGSAYAQKANAESNTYINQGYPYLTAAYFEEVHPVTLTTPVVTWDGDKAVWPAQEEATGYRVVLTKDSESVYDEIIETAEKDFASVIALNGSGSYVVSVTALGDGEANLDSQTGTSEAREATVVGAEVTVTLTVAQGGHFADGYPIITAVMADGTELPMTNGVARFLPSGTYTLKAEAPACATIEEAFTVAAEPVAITREMAYDPVWNGKDTMAPALVDGVYQISNGYELAWFRDKVNSGALSSNAILTADIDLGSHAWTPIALYGGSSSTTGYTGTFDGNGHTIANVCAQGTELTQYGSTSMVGAGLFGSVAVGGMVKALTVSGQLSAVQYSGGIVAVLNGGAVENCTSRVQITTESMQDKNAMVGGIVGAMMNSSSKTSSVTGCSNYGTISGGDNAYLGGIVGSSSYGTGIVNCVNHGAVTGKASLGGIVGRNGVPIRNCRNDAAITGTGDEIGGMTGFTNAAVTGCYNTAAISGAAAKDGVGGIVGRAHNAYGGTVAGCLNTGAVTATGERAGAIVGSKGSNVMPAAANCYYLESTCGQGIGSNVMEDDHAAAVTQEELTQPRLVGLLGGEFATCNDGTAPVLKWENSAASYVLYFAVTPAGASISLTKDGQAVTAAGTGCYLVGAGSYAYTVTKTGYDSASGTVEFTSSQCVPVTLALETFPVTFSVAPSDAVITVKNAAGQTVTAGETGYRLINGAYTYTVEKFGYVTQAGAFTVANAAVEIPAVTLEEAARYPVTLALTYDGTAPTDTAITVSFAGTPVSTSAESSLPDGDYTYKITATGYFTAAGEFTVSGAALNVPVAMQTRTTWDGTASESLTPNADGVYEIACAEDLAWFCQQVADGHTDYNAKLVTDIYLNDELSSNHWSGIGSYAVQYAGTFDGNGHAIRGLDNYLFGYTGEGGLIKNVTVYGAISGGTNLGGIAGAAYGSFENCVNYADIASDGIRVGGIAGIVYATGHITNCANYGAISTSKTASYASSVSDAAHVGGIVGYSYAPISGCANFGAVKAENKTYGAIGGIAGFSKAAITSCVNAGAVSGYTRTGGIVGIYNEQGALMRSCLNVGPVACTNPSLSVSPFCGAVVGTVAGSDGQTVGTTDNCYYLADSFYHQTASTLYRGGVGYGTDTTTSKSAEVLTSDDFVLTLNGSGSAFHKDTAGLNSGYPIPAWMGGEAPNAGENAEAVAADKAALTLTPTDIYEAMTLALASSGEHGTSITWTSSAPEIISEAGVITLPASGEAQVTMTATLQKGSARDTKAFILTVHSLAQTAKAELDAVVAALPTQMAPVYGQDTNLLTMIRARFNAAVQAGEYHVLTEAALPDVTFTVASTGENVNVSDTQQHIASDGAITYFQRDLTGTAFANYGLVREIKVTVAAAGASAEYTLRANIPWDAAWVKTQMQPIADALTFDSIRGENTDASAVTKNLTLPQVVTDYGWSTISWTSSDAAVTVQPGSSATREPGTGVLSPNETATNVTMTAKITFNLTQDAEPAITLEKAIPITLAGQADLRREEMQTALDAYTLADLTYAAGDDKGKAIDPTAVTANIQLLRPRDLGIDGGRDGYAVTVTAQNVDSADTNAYVNVNGYLASVVRPLSEQSVAVRLTVTLTPKVGGVQQPDKAMSKELGTIQIAPIKPSDIQAEVALMDEVIAHYFDGIKNQNPDRDHITTDLHPFQEAVRAADGSIRWIYSYDERTGSGIVPADLPDWSEQAGYRVFKSSNTAIIAAETLLVTQPKQDTAVRITSYLKSEKFGDYVTMYPDNADLKKLAGTYVSVTVNVLGTDSTANREAAAAVAALIEGIGTVTLNSGDAIQEARKAYDALTETQQALVGNYETLTAAEKAYAALVANRDAAKAVTDQIAKIGTVTLDSGDAIKAAREAYDALTEAQQAQVTNYETLTAAEKAYAALVADRDAAKAVTDQIAKIGTVTLDSGDAIKAAREAYDALTEAQQAQVTNYETLTAAEKAYAALVANRDAAKAVTNQIAKIGTVTLDSGDAIKAAREAYDALTEAQQAQVTNYETLTAAEKAYAALVANRDAAKAVTNLISKIGTVTLDSGDAIKAAREAYDALTEAQQAQVTNYETLTAAEKAYAALVANRDAAKAVTNLISKIGTVTLDSGDAIAAAREAYDALTEAQQAQVTNYETLTAAEAAYAALTAKLPFEDVTEGDWFYEDVRYVYQNHLFYGVSNTRFGPNESMTRAMLVAVLYRMAGSPAVTGTPTFTDVAPDAYYASAVIWANANDVATGYGNGLFGVNDHITREQMASMLQRYARLQGVDVSTRANLASFTDEAAVSAWARDAMSWAVAQGLIYGRTATTLVPAGTATRAEVAAILARFSKKI